VFYYSDSTVVIEIKEYRLLENRKVRKFCAHIFRDISIISSVVCVGTESGMNPFSHRVSFLRI
jgi:hypothetical protein